MNIFNAVQGDTLSDYYRAVNEQKGHALNCTYGAGADCNCPKGQYRVFQIKYLICGNFVPVHIGTDAKVANILARKWQKKGKIRYTTEIFHDSFDSFEEINEAAEMWCEKIEDWETD